MSNLTVPIPPSDENGERIASVQKLLLAWSAANGRDLPWRRTRNPYHVLVSEVMLQQIQVVRAIPFYLAFIERFPTLRSLADAPIADVIRVWGDLGRYRRIAYLHRAAREIVERFDGVVPAEVEALRSLPGVGPYTAGAVACFAFEQDIGFVDTNVRRVLGRLFLGAEPAGGRAEREIADLAQCLVPKGRGWDWNQGLLDFGALHCTARRPKCAACPLQSACAAYPVTRDSVPSRSSKAKEGGKPLVESNRYYRGRVLAKLRDHDGAETRDGIRLPSLGASVKPQFRKGDLPWLYGLVSGLAKDGLAHIAEERPDYDAEGGDPVLEDLVVRLP